jgi:hypothetical protein
MKSIKRRLLWLAGGAALLVLLEWVLARWMVDRQVVSTILAAGNQVPRMTFALAALFVVVRFSAVFLLPGSVLARLLVLALDGRQARRQPGPAPTSAGPSEPSS